MLFASLFIQTVFCMMAGSATVIAIQIYHELGFAAL